MQCYQEFKIHGCGPIYLDEAHAPIDIPLYSDQVVMYDQPPPPTTEKRDCRREEVCTAAYRSKTVSEVRNAL